MNCKECGATFAPRRTGQAFCSAAHSNNYHQRIHRQKEKEAQLMASNELDTVKQENDQLKKDNEALRKELDELDKQSTRWKEVIVRHHKQLDDNAETIERLEHELERLRKEKKALVNRPQTKLNREHLQDVLNKELRRQFPKDPEVRNHIGAIRAFNASFINALVTA
jgi:septal ring factor EnvC (AmiA/AmiB activator)